MQIFIAILLILFAIVWYKYYYCPRKQLKRYKTILENLGYKVYEQPFIFLGSGFLKDNQEARKKYKDPLYTKKHAYTEVDVAIGNTLDKIGVIFVKPELIKQFLSMEQVNNYQKLDILVRGVREATGDGMIFSQGQSWKNKRKIISKVFNFDLLSDNIPTLIRICDRWLDEFDQTNAVGDGKIKYSVLDLSTRIFNGVMMKCFFGCQEVKEKVKGQNFNEFMIKTMTDSGALFKNPILLLFGKLAFKYGFTKQIRQVKENVKIFRQIISQVCRKRTDQVLKAEKKERCTDILQALLYEKMSNKQEYSYTEQDILKEFSTFIVAGTDTSSHFFNMVVYYVARYPQIQQKLRAQIGEYIKTDEDLTYQNMKKLTYIDWIQYETTRHYGPVNGIFTRIAVNDNVVQDIPISKGTLAAVQPVGNHYSPRYFKDPFVFRPERWEKECDNLPPYVFLGFGGGPKSCIGKQLAHLQTKIVLVKLILRYKQLALPEPNISFKVQFLYEAEHFEVLFTKKQEQK